MRSGNCALAWWTTVIRIDRSFLLVLHVTVEVVSQLCQSMRLTRVTRYRGYQHYAIAPQASSNIKSIFTEYFISLLSQWTFGGAVGATLRKVELHSYPKFHASTQEDTREEPAMMLVIQLLEPNIR
jgi:hypothetical protein